MQVEIKGPSSVLPASGTKDGAVYVAQAMPLGASQAGQRFILGNNAAITGIAPVQAHPTTAAQWGLFNANLDKSLYFEELGEYLEAGTPGVGGVLLACLFRTPAQLGVSETGNSITSASGSGAQSKVIVKPSITITEPTAPNWYTLADISGANVTAFAASATFAHRDLQGRLVVPPLWGVGLAVLSPAGTTPLWAPFGMWVEA